MSKPSLARVLILDTCPPFYEGLSNWLEQEGYVLLPFARDLKEAQSHLSVAEAIVIGPQLLPPLNLQLCRDLRGVSQGQPILIMSPNSEDSLFQADAACAGAQGCVSSRVNRAKFSAALAAVLQGQLLYPPEILSEAFRPLKLTAREQEILKALNENRTDSQVAAKFHLSVHTVGNQLLKIYDKLGVHNRRDAVHRARHRGLL